MSLHISDLKECFNCEARGSDGYWYLGAVRKINHDQTVAVYVKELDAVWENVHENDLRFLQESSFCCNERKNRTSSQNIFSPTDLTFVTHSDSFAIEESFFSYSCTHGDSFTAIFGLEESSPSIKSSSENCLGIPPLTAAQLDWARIRAQDVLEARQALDVALCEKEVSTSSDDGGLYGPDPSKDKNDTKRNPLGDKKGKGIVAYAIKRFVKSLTPVFRHRFKKKQEEKRRKRQVTHLFQQVFPTKHGVLTPKALLVLSPIAQQMISSPRSFFTTATEGRTLTTPNAGKRNSLKIQWEIFLK